jgi:hypothetical protein
LKVDGQEKCFLKCVAGGGRCGKLLRISNPAETAKSHFSVKGCKGYAMIEAQEALITSKRTASNETGGASSSKQPRIDSHILQHANMVEASRQLSLFFIKSNVAFKLVEQENLVAA